MESLILKMNTNGHGQAAFKDVKERRKERGQSRASPNHYRKENGVPEARESSNTRSRGRLVALSVTD